MVVSHERSGTHFTMNALAGCFDFVSNPWLDIDRNRFNINYFHAATLEALLLKLADLRQANLIKSHHEFEFMRRFVPATENVLKIVYVHRDPADVMASFWRFLHTFDWTEGPIVDTALDFATAAPMGHLMRYQFRQYPTMLDRWANHVEQWIDAAKLASNVHIVRYEDLAQRYDETIERLGRELGLEPSHIARPSRDVNVVKGGPVKFTPDQGSDNRAKITELAFARFPVLMDKLGYGQPAKLASVM